MFLERRENPIHAWRNLFSPRSRLDGPVPHLLNSNTFLRLSAPAELCTRAAIM